ncbi:MAG: hypothetical protein M1816_006532 [Peltula sp. TS41687]|nr:MAG: hypothetical protein M1816_006532 [Peltula sp. TS41687]
MEPVSSKTGKTAKTPGSRSAFESQTFNLDMSIRVDQPVGSMSISPSGRDVVLASRQGLHIIDLDAPYSPPRHLPHRTPWEVADVQWSPFAARDYWVVSTSNQKALVWNLMAKASVDAIEHVLHAHSRAITDINFSAHHPDILATCSVDSSVHGWDLRSPARPVMTFCDWFAGATQVKWNRQDPHIIASSHDKYLLFWDDRKGASPIKSIRAHDTKIYGIDWNRTRRSGIVTCSLDKSIKFWDYGSAEDIPERVIRTPFPVWRARHAPFGWGLLAMPQRGDTDLHLYDRRLHEGVPKDDIIPPVHKFQGHEDQVKEFLWRWRGDINGGIDNREFQLVSWGTDRDLRLHRVDEKILEQIGYQRGKEIRKNLNITRKDAIYRSFRDEKVAGQQSLESSNGSSRVSSGPAFGGMLKGAISAGMKKAPIPLSRGWGSGGYLTSSTGMQAKQKVQRGVSAIDWMKGIKIGKKETDHAYGRGRDDREMALVLMPSRMRAEDQWESPESLGDEITQVADKYSKVAFDHVDIQKRSATFSMNGPWGTDRNVVYVKVKARFPNDYPNSRPATFVLEKTSSIPEDILTEVSESLRTISQLYASRGRGCLEVISSYLLGERDLKGSTSWLVDDGLNADAGPDPMAGEISSDDEEDDNVGIGQTPRAQDFENHGTEAFGTIISNANAPRPKTCGAIFAKDGRLACFFPPKDERIKTAIGPWLSKENEQPNNSSKVFQGFGRLGTDSPETKITHFSLHEDQEPSYDSGEDPFTSSSGSSSSSEEDIMEPKLGGFPRWKQSRARDRRHAMALSTDNSQLSVGQGSSILRVPPPKPKNIVSIHTLDGFIPAKKVLAEEYVVLGDGPSVCQHNARVAERHGFRELADFWDFSELILHNQVPLELAEPGGGHEPILIIARRAIGGIKRRDSGLDLAFDEAKGQQATGHLTGRTRWGRHPMGGPWLIDAMFKHFEQLADVQMLAMLSCVFAEPVTKKVTPHAMMDMNLRVRYQSTPDIETTLTVL